MRELLPNQNITVQRIVVGPTEFKTKDEEEDYGKETNTGSA